jgi:predicted cupin superfamily sugar epimerase
VDAAFQPAFQGASANEVIAALNLQPLDHEGAFWAPGPRTKALSSITSLITDSEDGFSAMHVLSIDEGWQWLGGAPLTMLQLHPDGSITEHTLDENNRQLVVSAGVWQGASTSGAWTLIACWCAPAFEWEHFTLGMRAALTERYADAAARIEELTRG